MQTLEAAGWEREGRGTFRAAGAADMEAGTEPGLGLAVLDKCRGAWPAVARGWQGARVANV